MSPYRAVAVAAWLPSAAVIGNCSWSAARTTVVSEFYFRPEAIALPGFDPSPTVGLWDLISRQDWTVCERAQLGISSRSYRSGVYPSKDRLLFDFNQRWRRAMGRALAD